MGDISHCWKGIENWAVDCHIRNNSVDNCRDHGLRDYADSVQSSSNHFFGVRTAIQWLAPTLGRVEADSGKGTLPPRSVRLRPRS